MQILKMNTTENFFNEIEKIKNEIENIKNKNSKNGRQNWNELWFNNNY